MPEKAFALVGDGENDHTATRLRADARGGDGGGREVLARAMIATELTAMNWRKGLLRLWLVLSLCWIAGIGVYAWKHEPGISSSQFGYEIASSPEKQNKEIVGSLNLNLLSDTSLMCCSLR
jgi:hypothetical protein